MHFRSLLPWLGLLSGACSTPTGKDSGSALLTEVVEDTGLPAGAEERPDIEIRPTDIDFGTVQVGDSASQTVKVLNHGAGTLEIDSLELQERRSGFYLSVGSVLIPSGQGTELDIRFVPLAPTVAEATAILHSNDPDEGAGLLRLHGVGSGPLILLDPAREDLEPTEIGCRSIFSVTLFNIGDVDLVLEAVDYRTASTELRLDLSGLGPLPWTIPPGSQQTVFVNYEPTDEGMDEGRLQIHSNDPVRPMAEAIQSAEGRIHGLQVDHFQATSTYDLSSFPVVASIRITVNGTATPSGWSYARGDNRIVWAPESAPVPGDQVEVSYWVLGNCR